MLAGSGDELVIGNNIILYAVTVVAQIIHGEVYAFQLTPGNRKVPGLLRATRQYQGIEIVCQLACRYIHSNMGIGMELHPLRAHLSHAPVDDALVQLEVGDAVT